MKDLFKVMRVLGHYHIAGNIYYNLCSGVGDFPFTNYTSRIGSTTRKTQCGSVVKSSKTPGVFSSSCANYREFLLLGM